MRDITAAVHGLGNIGRYVIEALESAPDFTCLGVIRRAESLGKNVQDLRGIQDFKDINSLANKHGKPDVVLICGPSRQVPVDVPAYLAQGINTVDSFDIHTEITDLVHRFDEIAKTNKQTAISAAGWDPGSDSVLRALFEAMTPIGTSFTNFGRGRSMGHSVAARSIAGVKDATSLTVPLGGGRHSRLVYILPQTGIDEAGIKKLIAADPYFSHDPLEVVFVHSQEELNAVADNSHGVLLERTGASGLTSNQQLSFDMRINNPALTAQIMVSCARAATRLSPGCYTMIDIPMVALLPGERMSNITRLV